ncbi:MAG: polysaccharide biosynthesis/export family protein, partial [Planctomycetes bacterium]|nr:polysaccharide biosynthesis/export family protein [Planctomycetota bacterium]
MRRFLWISLALAAACGCVTSAVVEDGEPAEDEAGVYWQSEALPPADPIDAAIRLAMGTVSGKSGKTKTWELGPDVASGDKLPAETARRVRIESIEGDDDVRPLDEAELPGSVTRARLEGMKEYPGIREFIDRAEAAPELPYGGYRFHVGDVLDIVVSGDAELSGRATVRQDGRMALPGVLVLLDAAGRTIEELTADVQTTLYGSYLKKLPKVSVDIIEGPGFAVTGVIGEGKFVRVALGGATRT